MYVYKQQEMGPKKKSYIMLPLYMLKVYYCSQILEIYIFCNAYTLFSTIPAICSVVYRKVAQAWKYCAVVIKVKTLNVGRKKL